MPASISRTLALAGFLSGLLVTRAPFRVAAAGLMLAMMVQGAAGAAVTWDRVVVDPAPGKGTLEKALTEINGDGRRDIVIGTVSGVRWYAFPASGQPHDVWIRHDISAAVGKAYEGMSVADLSGDGRGDIILSIAKRVEWLENPGGPGTGNWAVHPIALGTAHELRLADIDGDGRRDVVTSRTRNIDFQNSANSWTIRSWGGGAEGTSLDGMALLSIGAGMGSINIVGANSGGIYWFENPRETGGNARVDSWLAHRIGSNDTRGPALAALDVNRDGRMDVVQAPNEGAQGTAGLVWWQAPADRRRGIWSRHTIDSTWQRAHWISVADIDRDGHGDLVLTEQEQSHDPVGGPYSFTNDRVAVFYSSGGGAFVRQILHRAGGQNQAVGDIDGDGDIDILNANHGVYGAPNPIEVFINRLRQAGPIAVPLLEPQLWIGMQF